MLLDAGRAHSQLLWGDEIVSADAIRLGLFELVQHRYWQGHSPLYFILLKVWMFLSSGLAGAAVTTEFLLRLPSLLCMGLAGGLLAAAAWRTWGIAAGLLLVAFWLGNNIVERYAVEARPYALLMFFLAAAVWSSTRLWLAQEDARPKVLGIIAIASLILAAATIPVGVITVLAMEACSIRTRGGGAFQRFWRYRSLVAAGVTVIILAAYVPGIAYKSTGYWVERYSPLSWESLGDIAKHIYLNGTIRDDLSWLEFLAGAVLAGTAVYGLIINRHDFPVRLAAGLALLGPVCLAFMSVFNSLLIVRYFVTAVPGVLLLAVSATSQKAGHGRSALVVALACSAAVMLAEERNLLKRPSTYADHLDLITSLRPGPVTGGATKWQVLASLRYYLSARTGYPVYIRFRNDPLSSGDLPEQDSIYWLFTDPKRDVERELIGGLPVLCRYSLPDGNIIVLGKSRAALPAAMRDCTVGESAMSGSD